MASTKSLSATAEPYEYVPSAESQQNGPTTTSTTAAAFVPSAGSGFLPGHFPMVPTHQVAAPFGSNVGASDPRHYQFNEQAEFESYRTHFPAAYMYQAATPFGPNVGASDPYYYCSQCKEQVGFDSYLTCGDGLGSDMSSIGIGYGMLDESHALSIGAERCAGLSDDGTTTVNGANPKAVPQVCFPGSVKLLSVSCLLSCVCCAASPLLLLVSSAPATAAVGVWGYGCVWI